MFTCKLNTICVLKSVLRELGRRRTVYPGRLSHLSGSLFLILFSCSVQTIVEARNVAKNTGSSPGFYEFIQLGISLDRIYS